MNTTFRAIAFLLAVSVPAIAFPQTSNGALTRAQVRSELVQLEHAGYKPSRAHYPANIRAAEARIAAQSSGSGNAGTANGGTAAGIPQSGQRIPGTTSTYHH